MVTSFDVQCTGGNRSRSGTYSYHGSNIGMPTYKAFWLTNRSKPKESLLLEP
ncbi:UNVERIFIED_CONTAM: hypothetical protein FKN15_068964 [Acipenser sinensis]